MQNQPTVNSIIADLIKREGGYVNNPADKGGPTNYGITHATYANYLATTHIPQSLDLKNMSPTVAQKIYLTEYLIKPKINQLPELIRSFMFDMAVNNGPETAIKILQTELDDSDFNVGIADGIIGQQTIQAAAKAVFTLGNELLNRLIDKRLALYKTIVKNDASQKIFEKGWLARAESFRPTATA